MYLAYLATLKVSLDSFFKQVCLFHVSCVLKHLILILNSGVHVEGSVQFTLVVIKLL